MDYYVITKPCVGTCDTACVDVCPVDCISGLIPLAEIRAVPMEERASRFPKSQLFIDPEVCICCAACEPECPVDAIYQAESVPIEHQDDIARNAEFFLAAETSEAQGPISLHLADNA